MHNVTKQIKALVRPFVPATIRRRIRQWRKQWVVDHAVRMRQQMSGEDKAAWGVTLIGDMRRGNGLGEAGRTSLKCLRRAGVPTQEVPLSDENLSRMDSPYQVVMIHTNPDQLDQVCQMLPAAQWRGKYVIGDWIWEQETLPDWWVPYFDLFDEIWTPSGFAAGAIRKATKKPVRVLPLAVEPQCDEDWNRASFGLPDNLFLCLVAFDYHSVFARKNPDGAIRAFRQAFGDRREQVGLVLKARNTPPEVLSELRHSLRDWPNVFFLTEEYKKTQVNSLIRAVDVYISLHRAEGFGLVLAEAMYLGTPVVATNWSGNTEFMNSDVACMVKAPLVTLQKDELPFLKGSRWAEPDIDEAAAYLRRLFDEPQWRGELAARAAAYIREQLSVQAVSVRLQEYLLEIKEKL